MTKKPLIIIAAGGTGGHMFPAQALAEEMIERGWQRSATEDKICNDRLELASEALEVLTIFTIFSMDLTSDFVIILLINSIFLDFFSVCSLPLNSWVKIFSIISLFFSESEDVINLLPVLDKPVRTPVTKSFLVSKILSIDCPTFFSSDSFKIFDRKLILSSLLFSTIQSMAPIQHPSALPSFAAVLLPRW